MRGPNRRSGETTGRPGTRPYAAWIAGPQGAWNVAAPVRMRDAAVSKAKPPAYSPASCATNVRSIWATPR